MRKKALDAGLNPVAAFATKLPFSPNSFNIVIDHYGPAFSLESVAEKKAYAQNIFACLRSGGIFYCDPDSAISIGEELIRAGLIRTVAQNRATKFIKP